MQYTQNVLESGLTLKEVKRVGRANNFGWTDILDPTCKPYLVLDDAGKYHVLYWKAWFKDDGACQQETWYGSDWYAVFPERGTESAKCQVVKVWELPGIEYAPPTKYTPHSEVSEPVN